MLDKILTSAINSNASDIHIRSGEIPMLRIQGELLQIPEATALSPQDAMSLVESMMNERQFSTYREKLELDFALQFNNTRFRANVFHTINGAAAALRLVPSEIKSMSALHSPQSVRDLATLKQGLILFTGPTGSGKSTSLASIIDEINTNQCCNILTIEDPIEFIHKSKKSLITQRQVGDSTLSFASALRSALREDPDVILVGEMRDLETIQLALTAAETGHLVFGTLHTNSASQTIHRIIDVFPTESKAAIRSMLASSLRAVVAQRLIRTKDTRCAAFEVMLSNPSVRNLIREDQIPQIQSIMEINKKHGMITLKDSIAELIAKGFIAAEDAASVMQAYE